MNRKISIGLAALALLSTTFTSCEYDDNDLWQSVNDLTQRVDDLETQIAQTNSNISALQTIVDALKNQVTITSVEQTSTGYTIKFSDGQTAVISNGVNGTDAPEISIVQGTDGLYYWTLDGEMLMVDGKPVCASGVKGDNGEPAIAPQIRINPTTKEWEVSIDGGMTWESTSVVAEGTTGAAGESLFSEVITTDPDYVTFKLANDTEFNVPRYDASVPLCSVENCDGVQAFNWGEKLTYTVKTQNIADFSISKPDGWTVKLADNTLTITAPVIENTYAEAEGTIAINAVSAQGKALITKIQVLACTLRILTFEDADAKFSPYTLDYCGRTISTWTDLVDSPQYGGPMLYGDYMGSCKYTWTDENNTMLTHTFPNNTMFGGYAYWGGGHAISNYADKDLSNGDFMHQLNVYGDGGHNGSANFCMQYGYRDYTGMMCPELPSISFSDNVERVIDHMWVMNNTYAVNCYISGNGLTAKIGPDDWVKIIAIGYDSTGTKVGETSIYLCNGPDDIVLDWTKWNLSSLGKVAKVEFNITGSSDNGAGFSQPAYFAYDDVAVRF